MYRIYIRVAGSDDHAGHDHKEFQRAARSGVATPARHAEARRESADGRLRQPIERWRPASAIIRGT